jgi:pseudomonalisin
MSTFPGFRRGLSCIVVSLLTVLIPAGFAQTAWAPTANQAISLANAISLGNLDGSTPLHISVGLQLNNRSDLVNLVQRMNTVGDPLYGVELEPSQFVSTYAPTASQVNAVVSYLQSQGLNNVQVEANNMLIQADGSAAQVSAAFNTQLGLFQEQGRAVFANTAPAQVPSALSGIVVAVLGLNNAAVMQTPVHPAAGVPTYPFAAYYPKDIQLAYDAGKTPTGSKTSIAVIAEGDVSTVPKDLATARKIEGLPAVPVTIINAGLPSIDTAGVDEWDLDTQSSTGMAGTVSHLYMYVATSMSDADLALAFNRFAAQKVARIANASFGICEVFPFVDGTMVVEDNIFLEAAAQGQTVFASTGDTGSFCGAVVGTNGVPAGAPFVEYPAASPYVVAVGGTTLLTNSDGTYNNEITWNAGGGGISQFDSSPYWQAAAVPSNANNSKGIPDIAMDADPNSGFEVYLTCTVSFVPAQGCGKPGFEVIGGTSLSSPLAMGVYARLQSAHKNKLGFAAPHFYKGSALATSTTPLGFHDIILGNNGFYFAAPGWDYTTGLGSFDISAINAAIK